MATWAISKEETNFARLTIALLKVCAELLRETLLQHIPNRNIQTAIGANEKALKLHLNTEQKQLLFPKFPAMFTGSVADFDISLLYLLLRNISTIPPHGKGWGKPPVDQPRDCSLGANVERIRFLRNKISGHSVDGKVLDANFENFWTEIEDCVQDLETHLNLQSYNQALAKLKILDLDPEYAARCIDAFKAQMNDIQVQVLEIKEQQDDHTEHLISIKHDTAQILYKYDDQMKHLTAVEQGTGQIKTEQTGLLKSITDITQATDQIKSQQKTHMKKLSEMQQGIDQIRTIQQDIGAYDILSQGSGIRSQQEDPTRQSMGIQNESRSTRKRLIKCPFCLSCCAKVCPESEESFSIKKVRMQLIDVYTRSHKFIPKNPFDPDAGTDIAFVYTELEIEDYGEQMPAKVKRITEFETLIRLSSQNNKATRIYLEGIAGSGKTVYACKLITDWCNSHQDKKKMSQKYLVEFDICIPISLHNVNDCKHVEELICDVLGTSSGINIAKLTEYIMTNQERTLIVMDGLDEYRDNCRIVDDIIQRKALPTCTVVVTSRPWKIQDLLNKGRYVDRRACILGFSEENVINYSQRVFQYILENTHEKSIEMAYSLEKEMKEKRLLELSKLPLILLFMCYLWMHTKTLSKTETEIYVNVVKCLVGNYSAKRKILAKKKKYITLKDIDLNNKRRLFLTLGEIAYRGLTSRDKQRELMFDEDYLGKYFDRNHIHKALRIGLLSEQKSFTLVSTTSHLSFPHKSVQEYFAAYLFAYSNKPEIQIKIASMVDTLGTALNYENVLKFIIGINQHRHASALVLKPLSERCLILKKEQDGDLENYLELFLKLTGQINTETGLPLYPTFFDVTCEYNIDGVQVKMAPRDWSDLFSSVANEASLKSTIRKSCEEIQIHLLPTLTTLEINDIEMDPDNWKRYFLALSEATNLKGISIKQPATKNAGMKSGDLTILLTLLSTFPNLELFDFTASEYSRTDFSQIKVPQLPALKTLQLQNVYMLTNNSKCFFESLGNTQNLEKLVVNGSRSSTIDMRSCQIEVKMLTLTTLEIRGVQMKHQDFKCFFASLHNAPKLKNLVLTGSQSSYIDMRNCQINANMLALTTLEMRGVKMEKRDYIGFFASLMNNRNLETLVLEECGILDMRGCHIEVKLPALTTLEIRGAQMNQQDCICFFEPLWNSLNMKTLVLEASRTLDMRGCHIELKLPALTTLELRRVQMEQQDCKCFFESLHNAPHLEKLVLVGVYNFFDARDCKIKVPKLKTFEFSCIMMNPADWTDLFASLINNSPNIETIAIKYCIGLSGSVVDVSTLHMLHTVEFFSIELLPLTWECFVRSLEHSGRIQTLKIKWCKGWTGSKIALPYLANLTEFDLRETEMSKKDETVLRDSFSNAPKLRKVNGPKRIR